MASLTYLLMRQGDLPMARRDELVAAGIGDEAAVETLIAEGTITGSQAAWARAIQAGVSFVVLSETTIDQAALARVPSTTARRHGIPPIAVEEGRLVVAMADPADEDTPIVRFVDLLVTQAVQDRASDIHIEPGEHAVRVRFRVDGALHELQSAPTNMQQGIISRLKIMSDIDIAERRRPQDGRMSIRHADRKIDLLVATLPTVWGEKIVMRILDSGSTKLNLADLGLLPHNAARYEASYRKPYGMILVTGPTGSGKSTTLYTTLHACRGGRSDARRRPDDRSREPRGRAGRDRGHR